MKRIRVLEKSSTARRLARMATTAAPPNAAVSVSVAASRRRASRPISTPSCSSPPSRAGTDPSLARQRRFSLAGSGALPRRGSHDGTVDLVHGWDHDRVRVVETTRLPRSRAAASPRIRTRVGRDSRARSAAAQSCGRRGRLDLGDASRGARRTRRRRDGSRTTRRRGRRHRVARVRGGVPARRGRGRGPRCSAATIRRRVRDGPESVASAVGVRARTAASDIPSPRRARRCIATAETPVMR